MSLLFLSPLVVCLEFLRPRYILLLPFLRAATEQDHKAFALLAEVDAVAGAEIDLVLEDAGPNAFANAIAALAADAESSPSNHSEKRFLPCPSK